MDTKGLKEFLQSVSEMFFGETNMAWVGETSESPPLPLVTLRLDTVSKATFPFDDGFNEDGQFIEYYNAEIMFEVKAYSKGYVGSVEEGFIRSPENTSMNDLQQFADYMASKGVTELLSEKNVQIIQEGPVRDTTVAKSGSRHEYSAMVEYRVGFVLESVGEFGVPDNIEKNTLLKSLPQGAGEETGYFDTVSQIEGVLE